MQHDGRLAVFDSGITLLCRCASVPLWHVQDGHCNR